jgi:hypothetical protein
VNRHNRPWLGRLAGPDDYEQEPRLGDAANDSYAFSSCSRCRFATRFTPRVGLRTERSGVKRVQLLGFPAGRWDSNGEGSSSVVPRDCAKVSSDAMAWSILSRSAYNWRKISLMSMVNRSMEGQGTAPRRIAPTRVEGSCRDSCNPGQEHGVRGNIQIEIDETVQGDRHE